MKQLLHYGSTNITRHDSKFSCPGDLAPRGFAPLNTEVNKSKTIRYGCHVTFMRTQMHAKFS